MTSRIVRRWLFAVTLVGAGSFGTMLTPLTKFRVGSVSKPITAAAMGILMDAGRLDLERGERVRESFMLLHQNWE